MQLSADFTSLHGHRADAARGERELEFRRIAEERRALEALSAPEAPEILLGTGQLSLTKVMVLVGPERDPRDFRAVLRDLWHRFDPEDHMWLLPFAPLDTLDFTSFKMHVGSKLVLDAAGEILEKTEPKLDLDQIIYSVIEHIRAS